MSNGILIVDDSSPSRQSIRRAVELAGFSVCAEAVDGVDAIDKASALKPDLIVLDWRLPRLNGLETAAILRGRLPKTPIVLFTMFEVSSAVVSGAGITAIARKDEGIAKLLDCVRTFLPSQPPKKPAQPTEFRSMSNALPPQSD